MAGFVFLGSENKLRSHSLLRVLSELDFPRLRVFPPRSDESSGKRGLSMGVSRQVLIGGVGSTGEARSKTPLSFRAEAEMNCTVLVRIGFQRLSRPRS